MMRNENNINAQCTVAPLQMIKDIVTTTKSHVTTMLPLLLLEFLAVQLYDANHKPCDYKILSTYLPNSKVGQPEST